MKKLFLLIAVVSTIAVSAQTTPAPEGFTSGYFINNSNEKSTGFIKESFRKGNIVFISTDGVKKTYAPADITAFSIGNDVYTAYMSDFYKVVATGTRGTLQQKVTNNSGKLMYNGSEAYAVSTTEGKPGDYYLRIKATDKVSLVTKQNFEKVFTANCADCSILLTSIQGKQLDYASIEKAVEQYNACK